MLSTLWKSSWQCWLRRTQSGSKPAWRPGCRDGYRGHSYVPRKVENIVEGNQHEGTRCSEVQ